MVQYYYDKFTAISTPVYSWQIVWGTEEFLDAESVGGYEDYTLDQNTGKVSTIGASKSAIVNMNTVVYTNYNDNLIRYQGRYGVYTISKLPGTPTWYQSSTNYSKGSLVQSNITAEDGTYPANGRHTDGYWYVKGAAVGPLSPGTVINQPYSTAGNGGRKLVRLNDGTLVACVLGQVATAWFLHVYKSTDNGNSWTFLGKNGSWSLLSTASWALTTNGTSVFVLVTVSTNVVQFKELRISEMNGGDWSLGTNDQGKYARLDDNQSALAGASLAIDPTNGHLHATWASKNATYPNSFNIRYTKSTDGGVTWSAVEQVTNMNQSPINISNPTIVIRNSDALIITETIWSTNDKCIDVFSKKVGLSGIHGASGAWKNKTIYNGYSYAQSSPSAVVDKDGVIHVAWHGTSSDSGGYNNLYYAKSTDGGSTWTSAESVLKGTSQGHYAMASITTDKTGDLIILVGGVKNVAMLKKGSTQWTTQVVDYLMTYPSTLYDATFKQTFGVIPPTVYAQSTKSVQYVGTLNTNNDPTIALITPTNNQTLYENDTLNLSGEAYDADKDQSVTAYYQINSEQRKVLATNISQTQIALSKQLTFKGGKLYDGDTALTGTLADGVAHKLKVWAEDSEKASSAIVERTFYVVPNRAPLLSVDAVVPSGVVDEDKFKISGTASDQDANSTVKVTRRINAGNVVEIYSGTGGAWEFDLALSQLVVGQNTIVIEVVDNYGAKTSKTITLNKKEMKTPILQSVARYKIEPPKGSAKGVLLFIQRDEELDVKVELSMTLSGEQEQYETLTPVNTAPVQQGVVEDTFEHEGLEAKQNIILKITPSRTDLSFNHKIHLISGAVD
ncbi:hypothetical protein [Lysinibacillus sp. FSL K6-3209]|uniref:hypothetical protein n=1 Tax=Lysinibacillus sp. FSL K6-3209 TaxID=2921497 RepID=UPI0030D76311